MIRIRLIASAMVVLIAVGIAACGTATTDAPPNITTVAAPTRTPAPTMTVFPTMNATRAAGASSALTLVGTSISSPHMNSTQSPNIPLAMNTERIVIYTANLRLVVADPLLVVDQLFALTESLGGWVVDFNMSTRPHDDRYDEISGTVRLRIPALELQDALNEIKRMALVVLNESLISDDVTTQYVDMNSRLANLERSEEQLRSIMDEAESVEEILLVFSELTRIRGQIESIQGQLNYYDEAAAYSLIRVDLLAPTPTPTPTPTLSPSEIVRWNPINTAGGAVGDLGSILQNIADFVIRVLIVWLPFVLLGWFILWLIYRRIQHWLAAVPVVDPGLDQLTDDGDDT